MSGTTMSPEIEEEPPTDAGRILSWGVHILTASGGVFGVLALLSIMSGNLASAVIYMLLALSVDSMDGTLARKVGVRRHTPHIDGRKLDDIIDYLNFVAVPAVFMVEAGSVIHPAVVTLPVLASAFGFSRDDAKTDDDFFLGFPSYWNILAFYLWLLDYSPWTGTIWVVCLSVLVFVPWKYVYPSKLENPFLRYFTSYSGLVWAIVLGYAVLEPEVAARYAIVEWSLVYPIYYMVLSGILGGIRHRR